MTIILWTLRFGVSLGILGLNLWALPMALAKQAAVYSEPKSDTAPVKVVPPTTTIHGQDVQVGEGSAPDTDTIVNPPPPIVHGQNVQEVQVIDTSTGPHGQDLQVAPPTTLSPTDTDTGFVPPTPVSVEDEGSGPHGQDFEPVSGDADSTDSTDSKDEILEQVSIATVDDDKDGFTEETGDCDDANVTVYPGAVELCDGIDNDCNTATDIDDNCIAADQDSDGDGAIAAVDCNDHDATMKPGGFEDCDNKDNDCDGQIDEEQCSGDYPQDPALSDDSDGDGFTELAGDANDSDASVYPGAPELDDDKDNDLDGTVDEDFSDDDGDGVTEAAGDPNDADPTITQSTNATETGSGTSTGSTAGSETATSSSGATETGTVPAPSADSETTEAGSTDHPTTEPEDGTDEVTVVEDSTEDDTASADSDGDGGCSLVLF